MLSSLLSPPLPLSAVLGDSLSISCWTDDCWFSSLIPFAMFAKSISDFVNSFGGIPTIHASVYKRDTAWKVSVFRVIPFSCIRSKYREIHRISPYLVRMRENAWRTTPETGTFYAVECTGHRLSLLPKQIDCLAGLCRVYTFSFINKQVKIETGETPRGEKLPRYEISESFCFDESTVL